MGIKFEIFKNKFLINRPILVNQGQVRGNNNILKVGLSRYYLIIGKKQLYSELCQFSENLI